MGATHDDDDGVYDDGVAQDDGHSPANRLTEAKVTCFLN